MKNGGLGLSLLSFISSSRRRRLVPAVMGSPEGPAGPPLASAVALSLLALCVLSARVSSLPQTLPRVFLSFEGKSKTNKHTPLSPNTNHALTLRKKIPRSHCADCHVLGAANAEQMLANHGEPRRGEGGLHHYALLFIAYAADIWCSRALFVF